MSRELMKELVRAEVKCTDEAVGTWLGDYTERRLDEERRATFRKHLCECLQCMALYNIESKHKHGYIDPERRRAHRVKAALREWIPSRAQLLAALSLLVMVGSFAAMQTAYVRQRGTGAGLEGRPPESSALPSATPRAREVEDVVNPSGSPEAAAVRARQGGVNLYSARAQTRGCDLRPDGVGEPTPSTQPTPAPEQPGGVAAPANEAFYAPTRDLETPSPGQNSTTINKVGADVIGISNMENAAESIAEPNNPPDKNDGSSSTDSRPPEERNPRLEGGSKESGGKPDHRQ